ncbi:c-type cytochrome biogenesis protein CcsB [Inhella proteolytica]|uniref:C-type cytochrome biogenesis protein CcsB n=1 Tax=Inhella proteolytica TaxID=2795029 RepID=A0A931NJ57_9BURK|nr:c-type cytochrome biogenesis protein CcsB [Inhella proteolytica]MBH9578689.1 c-type cytochrome biogenesis protein CcsB [Inhella proteolytica]
METVESLQWARASGAARTFSEWRVHALLYAAVASWAALRLGPQGSAWDWGIGALALAAALLGAQRWLGGSRLVLAALGLAAAAALAPAGEPPWAGSRSAGVMLASSQALVLGMTLLVLASFAGFVAALAAPARSWPMQGAGRALQASVVLGLAALLLRWVESYRLGAHLGHIPISNLYEVLVLFVVISGLLQLRLMARGELRQAAALMSVVSVAAVGFLSWYALSRGADEIQPLVPALDSYWMKLHVPANFIGYGAFCLAAMLGVARLLADHGRLGPRLPAPAALEVAMHRLIGLGFVFFTVATILGALWAAEAWGGYWSWDPKETWALIVWLNYAAWLHVRLVKGYGGRFIAWWAVIGLLVTLFAFLGVNMYLAGMHSYGGL